jgi:hypothetical protein
MKKITLVLLFCICAVGFSQAQIGPENSGAATSNDSKGIFRMITAPPVVPSKSANVVKLTGKSSELEKSILAPKTTRVIEVNDTQNQIRIVNSNFNVGTVTGNHEFSSSNSRFIGPSANNPAAGTATRLANITGNQNRAPVVITHSVTQTNLAGNSVTCNAGGIPDENSFFRDFDLAGDFGIPDVFTVTDVEFGVDTVTGPVDLTLNIYSMSGAFPADFGTAVLQGTATYTADVGDAQTIISVPLAATIPAGESMIYEYRIDIGAVNSLFPASNDEGQTGISYIQAAACGLTTPGDLAGIGFADQHMVMNVVGDDGTGGGALMLPLTFEGQVVPFSDFNGSATQVIANPDASGVNTSANVAENVVPANAAFAGVNIVVPVDLTDDKFFSMNVWSPLAGTPVLLKIEGGANPPVERQVNMTTTGAWEEIIFDFSSEGAITFDSVTIFMNFNMTDPANQTFYWDNLVQMNSGGGGGGGMACSQENPLSTVAGGGLGSSVNSDFKTASDIVVAAGEDFTIDTIDTYFLTFAPADPPTTATVMYYEDAGGLPGAMIGSETVVPTVLSSQPWANPIADQYEMTMSVTPFTFPGDAGSDTTYWIEVSMGTATNQATVFWENTNDTPVVGNPAAQFDGTAGTWAIPDPINETVYSYEGECTPMGGGGMACDQENPLSAVAGGGLGSSVNSDFKTASDIVVAAGEDFTIDTIDTYFLTFAPADPPTTANVAYYEDAGGLPGALIGSETVVPTVLSSQPWANPIADQYEMTMSVTPFTFPGDAGSDTTYWIEVSMGTATNQATVFWENTNDTPVVGNPAAQFDGTAGTWAIPDPINETVYNYSGECTPIVGPADNDTCAGAIAVACGDIVVGDTLTNTDTGGNPAADEWYSFTGTGIPEFVTISLCDGGTDYDSLLRVFSDCTLANEIAANDDFCGLQSELTFASDGTSTYYIMVEGFGASAGNFSLEVSCVLVPPVPTNDLCADALPIACGEIVAGTTIDATGDSAVAPTCDTSVTAPGVWYVYEDTTGLITDITITMCNGTTDYDSKLSVYTGDCGAPPLNCIVGNDDTCGLQSEVSFQSDGATTFYILVHGFGGQTGNFEIEMTCTPIPPPNDMIANSIDVDEIGFPYTDPNVATIAATFEAGSPVGCDNAGARGVWYNFVAAADGTATATIVSPGLTGGTPDVSAGLGAAPTNVSMGLDASGDLLFTVNNGPLAGSYDAVAAGFGGEFTADLITGDTVLMIDDDTTGDPNDACDPLLNGSSLAGKIAITRRGACAFTDKVISAQNEGAIAVIVINNQPGGPIVMGGDNPDITIPALMLGDVDGEALLASFDTFLGLSVTTGTLAGSYDVLAAEFGGEFTSTLITGQTVLMIDDDTTGDPNDACDPLLNGASLAGKIAITRRGACAFTDKVIAAQDAGAIMVIVINNQPGPPIVMGGTNPDITIPALMIGAEDGEALLNSSLGFNTVTFYTAPNENAVETDLELVDWFENQCLPGITASIPTVAGQAYYVFVANHDGVTDIVIDGTNLGTEDNNTIEGFVYYPNPAGSTLNLSAQDTIENVVIYNMLGQKVLDQNVNAPTSELNVSNLATGAYILQVSVNGQIGTYKILKK